MVMDMGFVGMCGDNKLVFPFCKFHGKVITDPVRILWGDFTGFKRLAYHVGEDIFFWRLFFSRTGLVDVFAYGKFIGGSFRVSGAGENIFFADSFREVLVMELYQLLKSGETVVVCRNCGKPFAAFNRSDTFYCDRTALQDGRKSCKEYGAYYVRLEKVRHDEATHIYKQVYNCLQNRYRRTKTPESPEGNSRLKAETEEFLEACRAWKRKIKAGDAAETDYIIWLHKRKGEISNGEHPGEA